MAQPEHENVDLGQNLVQEEHQIVDQNLNLVQAEHQIVDQNLNLVQAEPNPVENLSASRLSCLDAILKAMTQFQQFRLVLSNAQDGNGSISELRTFIIQMMSPDNTPMENNGVYVMFSKVIGLLAQWKTGELSTIFAVEEHATKKCYSCDSITRYGPQNNYFPIMVCSSMRDYDDTFGVNSFEKWLKHYLFHSPEICGVCRRVNNVQRELKKIPEAYPIALNWEKNEMNTEIMKNTVALLQTEIDLTKIYKYTGEIRFDEHSLVSMVCRKKNGDYICVSFEDGMWVSDSGSKKEDIGEEWQNVTTIFSHESIRPDLMLFEKVHRSNPLKRKA